MTSSLREELNRNKERKQEIVDEAALAWVQKNVILINERLNRTAVSRLTNSILRFDEKFGPFKAKLPSIQSVLDNAELGLQLVLTGKTSDSRASDMFRSLSLIYNLLADFFSQDLPTLLKTPIFRLAKENPDVRLDSITGTGYSPKVIASAFAVALRPSKDELKMLGRVYKNVPLPKLKIDDTATELLSLSFSELQKLTSIGKVPMVAVPGHLTPGLSEPEPMEPETAGPEEKLYQNIMSHGGMDETATAPVGTTGTSAVAPASPPPSAAPPAAPQAAPKTPAPTPAPVIPAPAPAGGQQTSPAPATGAPSVPAKPGEEEAANTSALPKAQAVSR